MARVLAVKEIRDIDLQLAPDDLRINLLRNSLRFKLVKSPEDPREIGFMNGVIGEFQAALHEHTAGLFSLVTDNKDEYHLAQSAFDVRIYFETRADMDSFKSNFLLKYKLSN
jgi:hypothetical protein